MPNPDCPSWQEVFREVIIPHVSRGGLEGLRNMLRDRSTRVITGETTVPGAHGSWTDDEPCEACCPLAILLLNGHSPCYFAVGEVQRWFDDFCLRFGGSGLGVLIRTFDIWSHEELRANLLPELDKVLNAQHEEICR